MVQFESKLLMPSLIKDWTEEKASRIYNNAIFKLYHSLDYSLDIHSIILSIPNSRTSSSKTQFH